jgi:hypothetical protein
MAGGFFQFIFKGEKLPPIDVALVIWREVRRERERRKFAGMRGRALSVNAILKDFYLGASRPHRRDRDPRGSWKKDGFPFEGERIRKSFAYFEAAYYRMERQRGEDAGAMLRLQPWVRRREYWRSQRQSFIVESSAKKSPKL